MPISKKWYLLAFLLVAYFLVALYPILLSGFYSDDILFMQGTRGKIIYDNTSLCELVVEDTNAWMANARFAPLFYLEMRSVFYFISDVLSYKAYILVLNLVAVFSFAYFLYTLNKDRKFLIIALLVLPAFFQFRVMSHDAYTTFGGLYQGIAILNFLALSLFVLYLQKERGYYLFASMGMLLAAFCFSEMTLIFIPVYLVVALWLNKSTETKLLYLSKKLASVALITGIYLALVIGLRASQPPDFYQYPGLRTSFNGSKMMRLFHGQLISAIPMSYINYEKNFLKVEPKIIFGQIWLYLPIGLAILLMIVFLLVFQQYWGIPKLDGLTHSKWLIIIGLLLLLLPGALIMPSDKYQRMVLPGNGYLPVYLQNFGGAMLFSLLMHWLLGAASRLKNYLGIGMVVLFLLIVPLTFANNVRLVTKQNFTAHNPSLALEKALTDGLLKAVQRRNVIWLANNHHWGGTDYYKYLFTEKANKRVTVVNSLQPADFDPANQPVFYLSFPAGNPNIVSLKRVIAIDEDGLPQVDDSERDRVFSYDLE